jgi:hypothetical protein
MSIVVASFFCAGRPTSHHALIIDADIEPSDVVAHDHDDIGPLLLLRGRCGLATITAANSASTPIAMLLPICMLRFLRIES